MTHLVTQMAQLTSQHLAINWQGSCKSVKYQIYNGPPLRNYNADHTLEDDCWSKKEKKERLEIDVECSRSDFQLAGIRLSFILLNSKALLRWLWDTGSCHFITELGKWKCFLFPATIYSTFLSFFAVLLRSVIFFESLWASIGPNKI